MNDQVTKPTVGNRCLAKSPNTKALCDLEFGHVRTVDDWHSAVVTVHRHEEATYWRIESVITEKVTWALHHWEIPKPEPESGAQ